MTRSFSRTFAPLAMSVAAVLSATACQATPEQMTAVQLARGIPNVPSDDGLARLRQCESTDTYTIVSSNGLFHGAYQFTINTWDDVAARWFPWLVGVSPEDAAPHEQDSMARALWSERGRQPWPHCGKQV